MPNDQYCFCVSVLAFKKKQNQTELPYHIFKVGVTAMLEFCEGFSHFSSLRELISEAPNASLLMTLVQVLRSLRPQDNQLSRNALTQGTIESCTSNGADLVAKTNTMNLGSISQNIADNRQPITSLTKL